MDDSYETFYGTIERENPIKASSRKVLPTPDGSDYHQRKGLNDGS